MSLLIRWLAKDKIDKLSFLWTTDLKGGGGESYCPNLSVHQQPHSGCSAWTTQPSFVLLLSPDNRCEFRMMSNFQGYNYKLKVLTLPSGRTQCIHELFKVAGKNHVTQRFECAHVIQKLGLSEEEMVILKCLMVLTVGEWLKPFFSFHIIHSFEFWQLFDAAVTFKCSQGQ